MKLMYNWFCPLLAMKTQTNANCYNSNRQFAATDNLVKLRAGTICRSTPSSR